jgi:hypothetical protein
MQSLLVVRWRSQKLYPKLLSIRPTDPSEGHLERGLIPWNINEHLQQRAQFDDPFAATSAPSLGQIDNDTRCGKSLSPKRACIFDRVPRVFAVIQGGHFLVCEGRAERLLP